MTATPSPKGRSPPQLPQLPPERSMLVRHRKGRRTGSCLGLSCFGGSPVADSDAGHTVERGRRAPWFTWSRFRKAKKTVPVNASAAELAPEKAMAFDADDHRPEATGEDEAAGKAGHGGKVQEEEAGKQHHRRTAPTKMLRPPAPAAVALPGQTFFWKLRKGNRDSGGSRIQFLGSHTDHVNGSKQRRQQTSLPAISTKFAVHRGSSARTPTEQARSAPTATGRTLPPSSSAASPAHSRTTHPFSASRLGGTKSHKKTSEEQLSSSASLLPGRNDQLLGLSVMAVVLVMMVLFGRVSAVVFTCLWLYCLPRLRATMAEDDGGRSKSAAAVDLDSGEYKKRVVLEGLLQRNGRRPAGSSQL